MADSDNAREPVEVTNGVVDQVENEEPGPTEAETDEAPQKAQNDEAPQVQEAPEEELPQVPNNVGTESREAEPHVTHEILSAATKGDPDIANPEIGTDTAVISVRITVQPENFFFTQTVKPTAPCRVIYERIVNSFRVDRGSLRLFWEGRPLQDEDVFSDVCAISDDDRVNLELEFDQIPDFLRTVSAGEQVLRTIEVPVDYGDDVPSKIFYITMTKAFDRKPFLGGYRNTKTASIFHHATTQTRVEREAKRDTTARFSRVTQTQGVTRSSQTRRECGTQMSRSDLVVDTTFDRIVVAKRYFCADDLNALRVKKAMKLQAFIRGWRARKLANALRQERADEEAILHAEDTRRRTAHMKKRQDEIQRRTHPRTSKDFAVLYNELEAWRLQETQRIHDTVTLSEGERRVALQELLKKETKLLQTIDRLQIHANRENRVTSINSRLDKMASAKTWGVTRTVQVETPSTIRARELRDLYNGLLLSGLSIDERLDVLLHVKWTVKEFDCPLTRDIIELIDREADLLNRGRKDGSLSQLRQRTANLFLQFIDTPEFNPESLAHQTVPLEYMPRPNVQLSRK